MRSATCNLTTIFSPPKYDVYRIGGDEFAIIANGVRRSELTDALFQYRDTFQGKTGIRISMEYSSIDKDVDASFKNADEMLYSVKASRKSKSKVGFFIMH